MMLIIGGGEAGIAAASALREAGWNGPITVVGDELNAPYTRPPLSKALLHADADPAAPEILTLSQIAQAAITLQTGSRAIAIDRDACRVRLSDGAQLPYDKLLLATGASARRLTIAGSGAADIRYLRTFEDAVALHRLFRSGGRLMLIGGGFIALELAASARQLGMQVTVLESGGRVLRRSAPEEIAAIIAERHRQAGVDILFNARPSCVERHGDGFRVTIENGNTIVAAAVVAGIGADPNVELAAAAGLAIDNGIAVDGTLRSSDPHIFAAGDCCSFPHPLYDERRIRLEAWRNAREQAMVAARNMLGACETYDRVPWLWSDQYDITLQTAGLAHGASQTFLRTLSNGTCFTFHLDDDGRLVAATGIGRSGMVGREIRLAASLIAERAHPAPAELLSKERRRPAPVDL